MSSIRIERQQFMLAELGSTNPLPDFQNVSYVHSTVTWDDTLNEEDIRYMRYGRVSTILPYLTQDQYTREKKPAEKEVIILENDFLRAEFLPWMGGRLWSLRYQNRELLYHNSKIQPCNLALRNAWCSGGVEWNVSIRGHNMLTCENVFAELISLEDGTSAVRMYEFERIRGVVYRIEAYLPPESKLLFVQIHIENPIGNGTVPMYWWSNIAVPQRDGTRVIAPAETAILSLYDTGQYRMFRRELPVCDGMDVSRPCSIARSIDVFYDIKTKGTPFITALQSDHKGLVHLSTQEMMGRKLFVWGMGEGGKNWQRWLGDGQDSYIEIQAGIAKTQQDHIPMPDGANWHWLEAYGQLECDIDGLQYQEATRACQISLDQIITQEKLVAEQNNRAAIIANAHGKLVHMGAGWGALQNLLRDRKKLTPISSVCSFTNDSLNEQQHPWIALLMTGIFPERDPLEIPESYMVSDDWYHMLLEAKNKGSAAYYHLGVMQFVRNRMTESSHSFKSSIEKAPSPWAWRALARLAYLEKDKETFMECYDKAIELLPDNKCLCLEYAQSLLNTKEFDALTSFLSRIPETFRKIPRFLYIEAARDVAVGLYEQAKEILLRPLLIPDMREGELSLSDLWFTLHENMYHISRKEAQQQFSLPHELDFRMH